MILDQRITHLPLPERINRINLMILTVWHKGQAFCSSTSQFSTFWTGRLYSRLHLGLRQQVDTCWQDQCKLSQKNQSVLQRFQIEQWRDKTIKWFGRRTELIDPIFTLYVTAYPIYHKRNIELFGKKHMIYSHISGPKHWHVKIHNVMRQKQRNEYQEKRIPSQTRTNHKAIQIHLSTVWFVSL